MIDVEVSMKSLLFITEALEQLIGANGAKAVLRSAGQRAAGNLIEMLPLELTEADAIIRTGPLMQDLGFIDTLQLVADNRIQVTGNQVMLEISNLQLQGSQSGRYYVVGLFEGFFKTLSGSARKVISVETTPEGEYWNLG
jgi:hypothetical protein